MRRTSQQGIALVITLIMLSVVTVMAVVFLGISRRERASVGVAAHLTDARLAADAGVVRAQAEIIARIAARSNLLAYDLMVSTNYISPAGYLNQAYGTVNPTNVSYIYPNQAILSTNDQRQNIANLFIDPRPPVYIPISVRSNLYDFRFYLDLNRNGQFDSNGIVRVYTNGVLLTDAQNQPLTNFVMGDPEWIGVLEHPDRPHSPSNRFIARYAYLALPAGKALDVNFMHNDVRRNGSFGNPWLRYQRSQGVGSWELNLAAFLNTLVPGAYPQPGQANAYYYGAPSGFANSGYAFDDAGAMLARRYNGNRTTGIGTAAQYFTNNGFALTFNNIDDYGDDNLLFQQTNIWSTLERPFLIDPDVPANPWPGSYQANAFLTFSEFFDPLLLRRHYSAGSFADILYQAGLRTNTTELQYALGRMLAQWGTDSPRPARNKIHLNYANAFWTDLGTNRFATLQPQAVAQLQPWTAAVDSKREFFLISADKMLREQFGVSLATGIPVYPTNYYNGAMHRLVQVAANMLDTMDSDPTNRLDRSVRTPLLPSVFRPIFGERTTPSGVREIVIVSFEDASDASRLTNTWRDFSNPQDVASMRLYRGPGTTSDNAFGVPWVLGARKGWPNFNEFHLESELLVTRRLQAVRDASRQIQFQQSYEIGISNFLGFELWNSYTQAFAGALRVQYTNVCRVALRDNTLDPTGTSVAGLIRTNTLFTNGVFTVTNWIARDYRVFTNNLAFLQNSEYVAGATANVLVPPSPTLRFLTPGFRIPDWRLQLTNRFMFAVTTDPLPGYPSGRVVDLVTLDRMIGGFDVTRYMIGETNTLVVGSRGRRLSHGDFWVTNRVGGQSDTLPTVGITNQIFVSTNENDAISDWGDWTQDRLTGLQKQKAIDRFRIFMGLPPIFDTRRTNEPPDQIIQVPFAPTRRLVQQQSWMANDPLVHYHIEDLASLYSETNNVTAVPPSYSQRVSIRGLPNLGEPFNLRYRPWGRVAGTDVDAFSFETAVKDPMVTQSDDWDFPTNSFFFPNVGWLGRVHRGTPWQTFYLKSKALPVPDWVRLAGRAESHPTNDWWLLQHFTTALSEEAMRGRLSVNQTNEAAWAAVLGGLNVLSNTSRGLNPRLPVAATDLYVSPLSPQLRQLVGNLNTNRLFRAGQVYRGLGEILSAPALTDASPFLDLNGIQAGLVKINDAIYERIPQQILGLLKEDEAFFAVYSYGQALQPADASRVLGGPFIGLCTNYQVTAEAVTKTTFRIEERRIGTNLFYDTVVESHNVLPVD